MTKSEVGYGIQTDLTSSGLSDIFQNTSRQSDFDPNHRWA